MRSRILASFVTAALAGNANAAAVLTYSGYLRDAQGKAVTTTTTISFRFYPAADGGAAAWEDAVAVLPNGDGWFSAVLGANGANPLDVADFGEPLWLGLQVASDSEEMAPRMRIGASPYALTVDWAGVSGRPSTFPTSWDQVAAKPDYFPADPAVVQRRISEACPAGSFMVGASAAGTADCAADGITAVGADAPLATRPSAGGVTVGLNPCTAGEVLKSNGTGWSCQADTNTTYSPGFGLTLTGTTFSADSARMQSRISGSCAAGSSIRAITADGGVTCEPDDGVAYAAGQGLQLTGNTFSIPPDALGPREVQLLADSSSSSGTLVSGGGIVPTMGAGVTFTDATRCLVTVTSRLQPHAGAAYQVLRAHLELVGAPYGGVAGIYVPFSSPQNGWSAATVSWVFTVRPDYPIRFGCSIEGGSDLNGVTAYCAASYLCF